MHVQPALVMSIDFFVSVIFVCLFLCLLLLLFLTDTSSGCKGPGEKTPRKNIGIQSGYCLCIDNFEDSQFVNVAT